MAKNLPTSFSFSPYQGSRANTSADSRNLVAITDQLGEYDAAQKLEETQFANNEAIKRAMQSGSSLEEIQASNPELFASLGPDVDAATIFDLQNMRAKSASGFAVDQSGIDLNATSADFNVARTAEVGPNAISTRETQAAARRQSDAATRLSNLTTSEKETAIKKDEGMATKIGRFNERYAPGGGIDQDLSDRFDKEIDDADWSEGERTFKKELWMRSKRTELEDQPDFMLNEAAKLDIARRDFTGHDRFGNAYSEYGRQFTEATAAAAEQAALQGTIDYESAKAQRTHVKAYTKGDRSAGQITADGITFGKSLEPITEAKALNYGTRNGYNLDNEKHVLALKTIASEFPDRQTFEHLADLLKNSDGKIGDGLEDLIADARNDLEQEASRQQRSWTASDDKGQTADQIYKTGAAAYDTRTKVPEITLGGAVTPNASDAEVELVNALMAEGTELEVHPDKSGNVDSLIRYVEQLRRDLDRQRKPGGRAYTTQELAKKEKDLKNALLQLEKPPLAPLGPNSFFPGNRVKP